MQNKHERALVACSLWLHAGFIGAALLAAGLILLFNGGVPWPSALSLAFVGGLLAVTCWRRGWVVLKRTERTSPNLIGVRSASGSPSSSRPIVRGVSAALSRIPPLNRRHDDELRHPTPE